MAPQAIEAQRRAVDLRPQEPRYRNNLAALLVEVGRPQEAFAQLRAIYDEPVAHYNLAFLLNKRGIKPAALQEFAIALQLNPNMVAARSWVERLSREMNASNTALGPAAPQMQPQAPMMVPPPAQSNYPGPNFQPGPNGMMPQQRPNPAAPQFAMAPAQAQAAPPERHQFVRQPGPIEDEPPAYPPRQVQPSTTAPAPPAREVPLVATRPAAAPQALPRALPPAAESTPARPMPAAPVPADAAEVAPNPPQRGEVAPDPPSYQR
jgi:hypothetical protein